MSTNSWEKIFESKLLPGATPKVQYGHGLGQLHKAANKAGSEANFAVSAINYEYVDSGLLGAFIVSDAAAAGKVGHKSFCVANERVLIFP